MSRFLGALYHAHHARGDVHVLIGRPFTRSARSPCFGVASDWESTPEEILELGNNALLLFALDPGGQRKDAGEAAHEKRTKTRCA